MTIKREDVEKIAEALAAMAEMPLEGENTDPLIEVMHSLGHQAAAMLRAMLDERDALREALKHIEEQDIPRPVEKIFRKDGVASKHDLCSHGVSMYNDCAYCISEFAAKSLEEIK